MPQCPVTKSGHIRRRSVRVPYGVTTAAGKSPRGTGAPIICPPTGEMGVYNQRKEVVGGEETETMKVESIKLALKLEAIWHERHHTNNVCVCVCHALMRMSAQPTHYTPHCCVF